MENKTVIQQAIELLEQQRKVLQEMDLLGVISENELVHKSNQISTIQLLLAKLIPTEEKQMIDFHIGVMKIGLIEEGDKKWTDSYLPKIKETAEKYYTQTYGNAIH